VRLHCRCNGPSRWLLITISIPSGSTPHVPDLGERFRRSKAQRLRTLLQLFSAGFDRRMVAGADDNELNATPTG
jgi:hypothetical protein